MLKVAGAAVKQLAAEPESSHIQRSNVAVSSTLLCRSLRFTSQN